MTAVTTGLTAAVAERRVAALTEAVDAERGGRDAEKDKPPE